MILYDNVIKRQINRFWGNVDIKNGKDCWDWKAGKDKDGYGKFSFKYNGKRTHLRSHRFSYLLSNKELPDNLFVCHSCDNPTCVNPSHLWLGTNKDNQLDYINKGKYNHKSDYKKGRKGELNSKAKIKEQDVLNIRELYSKNIMTTKELSKKYNMSRGNIVSIISGRTWNFVDGACNIIRKNVKLNFEKAEEIRNMSNRYTRKELSKLYNISIPLIDKVVRNEIWIKNNDNCS